MKIKMIISRLSWICSRLKVLRTCWLKWHSIWNVGKANICPLTFLNGPQILTRGLCRQSSLTHATVGRLFYTRHDLLYKCLKFIFFLKILEFLLYLLTGHEATVHRSICLLISRIKSFPDLTFEAIHSVIHLCERLFLKDACFVQLYLHVENGWL